MHTHTHVTTTTRNAHRGRYVSIACDDAVEIVIASIVAERTRNTAITIIFCSLGCESQNPLGTWVFQSATGLGRVERVVEEDRFRYTTSPMLSPTDIVTSHAKETK